MINSKSCGLFLLVTGLVWMLALQVQASDQPVKVISLGGDVTEIVYALGEGDRLIARDTTSRYPEVAQSLPDVGYLRQLSLEGILAFRPDLVLISEAARPAPVAERLRAAGVQVVQISHQQDLEGVIKKISEVAQALGAESEGKELIERFQSERKNLADSSSRLNQKAVFILNHGGASSPLVAGDGSSAASMLDLAGIPNAIQGLRGYRPLSAEGLLQAQPDIVIVTKASLESLGGSSHLWSLPGLSRTPAGRAQKLAVVDDLAFLGFGPRTPAELLALRHQLEQL